MISDADQDSLRARAVQLVALFLEESDPTKWPSTDTKEGRGDRVWLKKSATQTLVLVEQIRQLLARTPQEFPTDAPAQDEIDAETKMINDAEALAKQILGRTNGPKAPH
jgi:hypothetical protein